MGYFYILEVRALIIELCDHQIFHTTTKSKHTPSRMALSMQANVLTMVVEPLSFVLGLRCRSRYNMGYQTVMGVSEVA